MSIAVAMAVTAPLACTLLTSLDGLSGPAAVSDDGGGLGNDATSTGETGPTSDGGATDAADGAVLPYAEVVRADGPLAYLRLGESAGTAAVDSTGNGNDGVIMAGSMLGVPGALVGDPDTAYRFAGAGGIDLGTRFQFIGTAPFTLEAWIRIQTADAVYRHLFTKDDNNGLLREGYDIVVQQEMIFFQRYVAGKQLLAGVSVASLLNKWSHVVSTYDGQLLRLYVDGKELARKADARAQLPKSTPFLVAINNGMAAPVLADVDEVAVYAKELAADRVLAHYQAGARP